jgi:murein L,D-transpeptidase YafK
MRKYFSYFFLAIIAGLVIYYFFPETSLQKDSVVTKLVVYKSKRKMLAFSNDVLLKTYTISLGDNPVNHKKFQGDERTPEGSYFINTKNPLSVCHKNLGISYPNAADRENAKMLGKPVGGDIKIHGLKNGQGYIGKFHRFSDWTNGCIGVTDEEIDELYTHVSVGIPIIINP